MVYSSAASGMLVLPLQLLTAGSRKKLHSCWTGVKSWTWLQLLLNTLSPALLNCSEHNRPTVYYCSITSLLTQWVTSTCIVLTADVVRWATGNTYRVHPVPKNILYESQTCVVWWLSGIGRWTCDLQVAGSIPGRWLSRNIGQLSLASLRGR